MPEKDTLQDYRIERYCLQNALSVLRLYYNYTQVAEVKRPCWTRWCSPACRCRIQTSLRASLISRLVTSSQNTILTPGKDEAGKARIATGNDSLLHPSIEDSHLLTRSKISPHTQSYASSLYRTNLSSKPSFLTARWIKNRPMLIRQSPTLPSLWCC